MKLLRLLTFVIIPTLLYSCGEPSQESVTKEQIELEIEIIKLESPVNTSIRGISIVDSNIVWLSGAKGVILKSINQGKTWSKLNSPDADSLDFRSIEAYSSESALIASAGFPARVYRTENSGKIWQLVYENLDSAAFINSIAFKNKNEGIILGDQINGRHLLLRTGDSGKTWKRIDSINIPKPLAVENGFAASGSCIAVSKSGRFFIGFGGEQSRVFSSINGYKWKAKKTPMVSGSPSSGIYSMASSGNGKIMAVGGDYTLADSSHYPIISTNDGKSWIKSKSKVSGYRSVIDYSTKEKIWVTAGTNGLDLTFDDGKTWSKFSDENINTLRFFPNTSKGIAANSNGEIFLFQIHLEKK